MRFKVVMVLAAVIVALSFSSPAFSSGFATGPISDTVVFLDDAGQAFHGMLGHYWNSVGTYPSAVGISFISSDDWVIALSGGSLIVMSGGAQSGTIAGPSGMTGTVLGVTAWNYDPATLARIAIWTSTGQLWRHADGTWVNVALPEGVVGVEASSWGKIKIIEK